MKVALIIERMEPWRGGAETSTVQFAGHLARQGCQVHMITTTHMPSTPELRIVSIRVPGTLRTARTVIFARRAADYVRAHDFDVVHCITPCLAADVYQPRGGTVPETLERNLALRRTGVSRGWKRITQRLNLKYQTVARLERRLLRRQPAPWVIAISDYVIRQLERHYHFDRARIRKVFNGVDPDITPPSERRRHRREIRGELGLDERDYVLLCVAHNFKLKGVGRLIEALARPGLTGERSGRRTVAVIVGHDNPRSFARRAERLGVADRVIFAGGTERIAAFFHAADVLVHPTYYDPCSRVVLEALAAGLPVITTRYNGAAEIITEGREGCVIDSPDDVAALADRIARLGDAGLRRMCAAAAPAAVADCTMREHAVRVMDLYREIVERNRLQRGGSRG